MRDHPNARGTAQAYLEYERRLDVFRAPPVRGAAHAPLEESCSVRRGSKGRSLPTSSSASTPRLPGATTRHEQLVCGDWSRLEVRHEPESADEKRLQHLRILRCRHAGGYVAWMSN